MGNYYISLIAALFTGLVTLVVSRKRNEIELEKIEKSYNNERVRLIQEHNLEKAKIESFYLEEKEKYLYAIRVTLHSEKKEIYPNVYSVLSRFAKYYNSRSVTIKDSIEFIDQLNKVCDKAALYYGERAYLASYALRQFIGKLSTGANLEEIIDPTKLKILDKYVQAFEAALREEINPELVKPGDFYGHFESLGLTHEERVLLQKLIPGVKNPNELI